jgi:molybdopterin-binding protein
MARRRGVLIEGQLFQTGSWKEVFNSPRNPEVARFVGVENMIDGVITSNQDTIVSVDAGGRTIETISRLPAGRKVCVCLRPEDVTLALTRVSSSARNVFPGTVRRIVAFGALMRVEVDCGFPLISLITSRSAEEMEIREGMQLFAGFKATAAHLIEDRGRG